MRFADDFATNTLKEYQVEGDVTWQKGAVRLGKEATLTRKVALGFTSEVRAVIRLPAGNDERGVYLRLQEGKQVAEVALLARGNQTLLLNRAGTRETVLLEAPAKGGDATWVVRCEVHHGLVRAKACRLGTEEPKEWRTVRDTEETDFEPTTVSAAAGKASGGWLVKWKIAGVAPAPLLSDEQQQKLQEAFRLNHQVYKLWRAGRSA